MEKPTFNSEQLYRAGLYSLIKPEYSELEVIYIEGLLAINMDWQKDESNDSRLRNFFLEKVTEHIMTKIEDERRSPCFDHMARFAMLECHMHSELKIARLQSEVQSEEQMTSIIRNVLRNLGYDPDQTQIPTYRMEGNTLWEKDPETDEMLCVFSFENKIPELARKKVAIHSVTSSLPIAK